MFVIVERHLEYFESLVVILVIQVAQKHNSLRTVLSGKDVEVEQHHFAGKVGQPAHISLVVKQLDIYDIRRVNNRRIHLHSSLLLKHTHILHSFEGNVVQVLATQGIGVIGVPRGGYGSVSLVILAVTAGVEYQLVADCLEQGEIRIRTHRCLVYIVPLNVFLVFIDNPQHAVARKLRTHSDILLQCQKVTHQFLLLKSQFTDLLAVLRAIDGVTRGHGGQRGFHRYRLGRVDTDIDYLIVNAQTIELRRLGRSIRKLKTTRFIEFSRVNNRDSIETYIFEI